MVEKDLFDRGLSFEDYIKKMSDLKDITEEIYSKLVINDDIKKEIRKRIEKYGTMNVLCVTEPFCGDSACNLPIVKKIFEEENVNLRIFIRSLNSYLEEKLYSRGIKKIPVFIFYDSEFKEISIWIERPKKAYELIDKWKSEHPEYEKLKNSKDKRDKNNLNRIYRELVNYMKENYISYLWKETALEILNLI